jgi:hypothetical protein
MSKLASYINERQFYGKGTPQERSGLGLRKSIEKAMIVGGLALCLLGSYTCISSSREFAEKKRLNVIENVVGYKEGKHSLREKMLREDEINHRPDTMTAVALPVGFLGFFSLLMGLGYRGSRKEFEKYGFVND